MAAHYFLFKQFTIAQQHTAMKVTADAIALGAWASVPAGASQALDIGCGTGLLSLMLAQRFPRLRIDALELEPQAALQATENIKCSRFNHRIKVYQGDARQWQASSKYDFIICNPPFYSNGPKSITQAKNLAWHAETLTFRDLSVAGNNLLSEEGRMALLLPYAAMAELEQELKLFFIPEQQYLWSKQRILSSWRRREVQVNTDANKTGLSHGRAEAINLSGTIKEFLLFG